MQGRVTKKNIVVTILFILVVFGGIPIGLWGISKWRQANAQERLENILSSVIPNNAADARAFAEAAVEENLFSFVYLKTDRYFEKRWKEYDQQTRRYKESSHPKSEYALERACERFALDLKQADISGGGFTFNNWESAYGYRYSMCTFVFQSVAGTYLSANAERITNFSDEEDIEHVKKLIDRQNEILPWSIHRDDRTFHVFVLVQQNPLVVWQLRIPQKDQEY